MNTNEIIEKLFLILNKACSFEESKQTEMKRATDDEDIIRKLSIRLEGGHFAQSTGEFLDEYHIDEMNCYRSIIDYIPIKGGLNPHKIPYPYDYVVTQHSDKTDLVHIRRLDELLVEDDAGKLNLFNIKHILHIGQKGSGKTITQNVWLYKNNNLLEKKMYFGLG